jgi:uncharacterized damage-inducible protein DinB
MIDPAYCQIMAQYNQWMNQKLYAVCAEIPDGDRKQDRGAFFKSIHGTLNHLLDGDRTWMSRFVSEPVAQAIGQELCAEFEELRQQRQRIDCQIVDWADQLSSTWLAQPFEYTSNVDGKMRSLPTWVLVTHFFNHQTHHRGQLTTLLSQAGHDPGITDLPWLPSLDVLSEGGICS